MLRGAVPSVNDPGTRYWSKKLLMCLSMGAFSTRGLMVIDIMRWFPRSRFPRPLTSDEAA